MQLSPPTALFWETCLCGLVIASSTELRRCVLGAAKKPLPACVGGVRVQSDTQVGHRSLSSVGVEEIRVVFRDSILPCVNKKQLLHCRRAHYACVLYTGSNTDPVLHSVSTEHSSMALPNRDVHPHPASPEFTVIQHDCLKTYTIHTLPSFLSCQ